MNLFPLIVFKRKVENLLIYPFVWLGKQKARKQTLPAEFEIFFFFPFYHIGGAEKVHAQIAQAFRGKKAIIFFTRKSHNALFKKEFEESGHSIRDISTYTDNKWKYWNNLVYRGILSYYINRQKYIPIVFNGQCNFGYKLSPWIKPEVPQLELIHSLNSFSYIRIPYIQFYSKTVMISLKRIEDHYRLYDVFGIPAVYKEKIQHIMNGIHLPDLIESKDFFQNQLKVLYAGRATPEKRVHVVSGLAKTCEENNIPVSFDFLGDVGEVVPANYLKSAKLWGNQTDATLIDSIYRKADILIITSSEEGFPMVVMEAMARGCIIMGTAVGDMPLHVRQGACGLLFSSVTNESLIVREAVSYLQYLLPLPLIREQIFTNNITYARENFGIAKFEAAYHQLFESVKPAN
jgi:L-malate glycosyltransferase